MKVADIIKWVTENRFLAEILWLRIVIILIWGQILAGVLVHLYRRITDTSPTSVADAPVILSSSEYLELKIKEQRYNGVLIAGVFATVMIIALLVVIHLNGGKII